MTRPRAPAPSEFDDVPETAEIKRPRLAAGSIPAAPRSVTSPPAPRRPSGFRRPTRGERIVIQTRTTTPLAPGAAPRRPPRGE